MTSNFNPLAMFNLQKQAADYSNADNSWLKLPAGTSQLRICPPWTPEQQLPVRMIVNHWGYKTKEQNERNPMCYSYVFENQEISQTLIKIGVLKPTNQMDFTIWQKIGCVFCRTAEMLKNSQNITTYFPKPQFLWNVVNRADGKIYKWSTSKKRFEEIGMIASMIPTMFNAENGRDFFINATGTGKARRYSAPQLMPQDSPIGVDLAGMHNLDVAMGQGYVDTNLMIELMQNTHPQILNMLGINPGSVMVNQGPQF